MNTTTISQTYLDFKTVQFNIETGYETAKVLVNGVYFVPVNKHKLSMELIKAVLETKKNGLTRVKELVDAGADINKRDSTGHTALMLAAKRSNDSSTEGTVKIILDAGADVNAKDNLGWTALMYAAKYSATTSTEATVKMLIDAGADVNAKDDHGRTALMLAAKHSNRTSTETTVKLIIDADADVNAKNIWGWTALMFAANKSHVTEATVKLIIDAGADVDTKNNKGKTVFDLVHDHKKVIFEKYKSSQYRELQDKYDKLYKQFCDLQNINEFTFV